MLAGVVALLAAAALGGLWLAERDVLPERTRIAGIDVGGRTLTEARLLAAEEAARRVREPVEIRSGDATFEITGAQLGAAPLVDDAIVEADGVGLLGRLARRLGFGERRDVVLRYALEAEQVRRLAEELEKRLAVAPRDARLVVDGTATSVRASQVGRSVAVGALKARLRTLPERVVVPLKTIEPQATTESAEAAKRIADRLLSEARSVALGDVSVTLPPGLLARALVGRPTEDGLVLELDVDVLRPRLRPAFRELERAPRDARFRIEGTRALVVPAQPGRELDVERISTSLLGNLRSLSHRARFVEVEPALTTDAAEQLQITELVAEFETFYPCCAPRVTNIQRAAELLDGTILEPGGTFSLNDALGQRTTAKGFVPAPQIRAGRLEDAVGGGISQVATTLYNAAFFAGFRLDEHQPHEFYISRYPMGREATVSWRSPELIFTNDWPAGALLKVRATDTAISVRVYSTKLGRRVETTTGEPYATTAARTITSKNPSLAPGQRVVLQEAGASGFTVQYTRKVWAGSRLKRDETTTVRYRPQNGYVEVGPPKKKPKPGDKKPKDGEPAPGDGQPDDGAAPPSEPAPDAPVDGDGGAQPS